MTDRMTPRGDDAMTDLGTTVEVNILFFNTEVKGVYNSIDQACEVACELSGIPIGSYWDRCEVPDSPMVCRMVLWDCELENPEPTAIYVECYEMEIE